MENNLYQEYYQYPQYFNGTYGRYININMPYKYIKLPKKYFNYCFSSEEENIISKPFHILKGKISPINNQKFISRANTEETYTQSNSQNNLKNYNHQYEMLKKIRYRKNEERLNNNNYTSYGDGIEEIEFNLNSADNISYNLFNQEIKRNKPNNYCLKKKFSYVPMNSKNYLSNSSPYHNLGYHSYSSYNQPFMNHDNHNLFNKEYRINANENYFKNEYDKNTPMSMIDKEINYDSKNYGDDKFVRINEGDEEYFNNFKLNTERTNNEKGFYKEKIINTIYNKNTNLTKIVKNNNRINRIDYKPINKNIAYSNIGNFYIRNEERKDNEQNGNKKKINILINTSKNNKKQNKFENFSSKNKSVQMNKIKKISLINLNGKALPQNNCSFYEIKSLSKFSPNQKKIKSNLNNNQIINIVDKKNNNEKDLKVDKEKYSNTKLLEYNNMKDKINLRLNKKNLAKLNTSIGKERKTIFIKKEIYKKTFELTRNSERNINKDDYEQNKENINIININNSNYDIKNKNNKNNKNDNNIYIIDNKIKKGNNKIIKIEKKKNLKNFQGNNKSLEKKNAIIIMKNKNNNRYLIKLKNKKPNCKRPSNSIIYSDNKKPIELKKMHSSNFTYFPISNKSNLSTKKNKKINRLYGEKNIVQLSNINIKTYEEDFPLNTRKNNNDSKKILKPQITIRIALFGKKEPEYEKYFLVNVFHSKNIKEKPVEAESEF